MKRFLLLLLAVLLIAASVMVVRALRLTAVPPLAEAIVPLPLDADALAQRLSEGLRIATISQAEGAPIDDAAFAAFHALLAERYPRVHAALSVERVGAWSLLYRWDGLDATSKPALLAAHMDVVPVEPGTEAGWTHPAFDGVIADGFVWGRGALDNKSALMAQMEALEWLLAQGHRPTRTLYFAYGHDEEIGGRDGAARIAELLRERGVQLAFTLDEGSAITQGVIAGIDRPVAAIMAGEKGYVSFRLTAKAPGGHSSTPSADNAIVRLSRAIERLDAQRPSPQLVPPVAAMLDRLAPEMPFSARLLIANRGIAEPLLLRILDRSPMTSAVIRTTQAATLFNAGIKDNVLPTEASAVLNYRLLPGERIADLERHLRRVIDDERIAIQAEGAFGTEAPPVSDADAPEFALIARTVNEVFPQALVSSGIILATTDNRYYAGVRDQGYYFAPFPYTPDDGARIHGTDERIGVEAYADMVRFYIRLLQNAAPAP